MTLRGTLKAISKELIRNNIQFCITGGFAYSVYAEPRTTVDIDIVTLLSRILRIPFAAKTLSS